MPSPNILDALRVPLGKKTKVLRGATAQKVLERVSKTETKGRSTDEVRKAMYGDKK